MSDWLSAVTKGKLWDFPGGVHPEEHKAQSASQPIRRLPVGAQLVLPLRQHAGLASQLLVQVGERVRKGQPLTCVTTPGGLPLHAPTSGTVAAIEERASAHPSALPEPALILNADGLDEWFPHRGLSQDPLTLERRPLLDAIAAAGIAGLGGAGFPTARKLALSHGAELLIINGVECEPYISCDDALMRQHASEILRGVDILAHIAQPKLVLIAVEDNKPEAATALRAALGERPYQLRMVPTKYPSGGERQLVQLLTGREVPSGGYPADIGILMQNVGTAFAIKRALDDGEPLIERLVTLCGGAIAQPGNYWVPLGTQVGHLLTHVGWKPYRDAQVIMGGPMMGFALPHTEIPVVKISNCILAPARGELADGSDAQPCIRCGACAEVCPARLLPQQLFWHSSSKNHDKAREYHLFDCIECGACAYVCPSAIPLVHHYRVAKAEIRATDDEARKAEQARERFEARQQRLEREKQEREARHQQAQQQRQQTSNSDDAAKAAVAAALARAQARRQHSAEPAPAVAEPTLPASTDAQPDNSAVMAERARRKAERDARQAEQNTAPVAAAQTTAAPATDAKAAAAAAIARAKAKAQQAAAAPAATPVSEPAAQASEPPAPTVAIDAKAAAAAAIARAKAKAQLAAGAPAATPVSEPAAQASEPPAPSVASDAKAAAIARAKAKAQQAAAAQANAAASAPQATSPAAAATPAVGSSQPSVTPATTTEPAATSLDSKKAAIAAAVARAKSHAAERDAEMAVLAPDHHQAAAPAADASIDSKKAAIAAAVARAKARQAERQGTAGSDNDSQPKDPT
ncbi:MAG: electron transport complex subunit RsxC [Gammaproteobacteria bacterium]|nr:electron transport complex subunit RsxC [Gammaproteobacteria bacterium]